MVREKRPILLSIFYLAFTIGISLLFLYYPSQASAEAIFTVNTISDTDDGTCDVSHCSLREAINAANGAGGADSIEFSLLPGSTITLAGTQLPIINDTLTIDGSTALSLTISGASSSRIFQISNSTAVTITTVTIVNGQTVCSGCDGGGIYNDGGTLNITNSTISANSTIGYSSDGGGIYNSGGILIITNSKLSGNSAGASFSKGGGITSLGTLIVSNSIFSENSDSAIYSNGILNVNNSTFIGNENAIHTGAGTLGYISNSKFSENLSGDPNEVIGYGGGIFNAGTLTISNSTFITNVAGFNGGGIYNQSILSIINSTISDNSSYTGGGIFNDDLGTLNITNSSISSNTASYGTGGIFSIGLLSISNSTLSGNVGGWGPYGGGIFQGGGGMMDFTNTIIANSVGGADCSAVISTNINNLVEDGSCNPDFSGDPLIGPLLYNGGLTPTHALLPGSPAIDSGDNASCEPQDQRSVPRPIDGDGNGTAVCDIGSVEVGEYFTLMPVILKASG